MSHAEFDQGWLRTPGVELDLVDDGFVSCVAEELFDMSSATRIRSARVLKYL